MAITLQKIVANRETLNELAEMKAHILAAAKEAEKKRKEAEREAKKKKA